MTELAGPIRYHTSVWVGDKYRARGTLLLYPDKLVHVSSRFTAWNGFLGLIGVVVIDQLERSLAPRRVAAGGKGVTSISLDSMVSVENRNATGIAAVFGGRHLVVTTSESIAYKFSGRPDYWIADLASALAARGHQVLPTPDGISMAAVPGA